MQQHYLFLHQLIHSCKLQEFDDQVTLIKTEINKTNYLNYLETEHIIDMMLALYSDHQEQMRSIIDVTLMNERKMIIAISQKNSVKTKDIQKKLHKLRVLYELNERRNSELML